MADRFDEILLELRTDREQRRAEREAERAEREVERAEWTARMDRMQDQTDQNLRFLGELNRRGEVALRNLVRSVDESVAESRARTAEINARITEIQAEGRAHTQAIFSLIDRIERLGGPPPAG